MASELIQLLLMGIYFILAIMIGLVCLYIFLMKPKNSAQVSSTFNDKYKNGNSQTFENNYKKYKDSREKEEEDPIQNL